MFVGTQQDLYVYESKHEPIQNGALAYECSYHKHHSVMRPIFETIKKWLDRYSPQQIRLAWGFFMSKNKEHLNMLFYLKI